MNTNYFFNQPVGVNRLEKLLKTKFHYTLDVILNQRTQEWSSSRRNAACRRGPRCAPSTGGCTAGSAALQGDLGRVLDLCEPPVLRLLTERWPRESPLESFTGNQMRGSTETPGTASLPQGPPTSGSPPERQGGLLSLLLDLVPQAQCPTPSALAQPALAPWPFLQRGHCHLPRAKTQQHSLTADPAAPHFIGPQIL